MRMLMTLFATIGLLLLVGLSPARGQAVLNPTVTGPVPGVTPGDPSRNYPWFATFVDLASVGYVEEEFFFAGIAGGTQYTSRMLVRRPGSAAQFNGTVLVEWLNVTSNYDWDSNWNRMKSEILRSGYAWVGVSAQRAGVYSSPNGLKVWNPLRYAPMTIPPGTTALVFGADVVAYELFAQAMQAVKHPLGIDPMGGLRVERLIATGASQSALTLGAYYNTYQAAHRLADAFYLTVWSTASLAAPDGVSASWAVNTEGVRFPVMVLNSETDVASVRQPNTDLHRLWEIAGSSHSDYPSFLDRRALLLRDTAIDTPEDQGCAFPPKSRIPYKYVANAALFHVDRWLRNGHAAPDRATR